MTPEPNPQDESLPSRAQRAAQIVRTPRIYKVCEGCESIVHRDSPTCPNCRSYRFDDNVIRITTQADILGKRLPNSIRPGDLL